MTRYSIEPAGLGPLRPDAAGNLLAPILGTWTTRRYDSAGALVHEETETRSTGKMALALPAASTEEPPR